MKGSGLSKIMAVMEIQAWHGQQGLLLHVVLSHGLTDPRCFHREFMLPKIYQMK